MSNATDRVLECADCGGTFVFTAGEQEFYQERGFSDPKRCPDCRASRKAGRSSSGRSSFGGGSYGRGSSDRGGRGGRQPRKMYDVICAACGEPTQVPFEPRDDRPVYCRDCYQNQRR